MAEKRLGIVGSIRKTIDSIENSSIPLSQSILTILACIGVRNILEDLSDKHLVPGNEIFADFYLQTIAFHVSVFLMMGIILMALFGRSFSQSVRLLAALAPVLFIGPLVDMIVRPWMGAMNMEYVAPSGWNELWRKFLTFFGPLESKGVTIGQRTQIILMAAGLGEYALLRGSGTIKGICAAVLMYVIAFTYAHMPFFVKEIFQGAGLEFTYGNAISFKFYLVLIAMEMIAVFSIGFPKKAFALAKDLRYLRLLHVVFFFAIGFAIAESRGLFGLNPDSLLHVTLAAFAIFFAYLFSILTNNMQDIRIDVVTNAHRPHVTKTIDEKTYAAIGWICLSLSILYAGIVGHQVLILVWFFLANFYLYSMSPLRAKRVTFFGKALMSVNFFIVMLTGFFLGGGALLDFPKSLALWTILAGMAIFNFVDLKDTAGDKKEGIKTLPVLLGDETAKYVIGCFFLVGYSAAGFITGSTPVIIVATLLGAIQFAFLLRKKYDERPHFIISLLTFVMVFAFVVWGAPTF